MKKQPQISEEKILQSSWELLSEEGLEKFSMRKLATRIGIQAPSLYWYFKSKQHLYQGMANQISGLILEGMKSDGEWKEQLTELANVTRKVLSEYPCSTEIMMMTLPHEKDIIRFSNRMLQCVENTDLTEAQKFQVVTTLINYVYYFVLDHEQHERNVQEMVAKDEIEPEEEMLERLDSMSEEEAGLFRNLFTSGTFEVMGTDESFEFGLNVILLGVEQVLNRK
ncbi:transcriptional regulator [Kurthia zopfii]|uniref:TetR family transcriptional regulator n=1 Tax=Kurthia zopfii TaxID=1650 RepID=A0A2U3AH12_9BACL|nr:TetR/AcrR family transcriptional regulator C-terminal domain-containing protein [Kurthia zopfii]PWI23852.1 TetR family transcriptional regulator [Kurthia zopfii]TDR43433.1 TetR family transcriptional regulator [Kurthia zopfii]STX10687.1 Tetracycline repressor protein class B from transposon Tn10 [Kurthia zopfii]VEI05932.1 Tetracycline repressor protein class B from transposon Tn10 [Kurthia zopfii]GEK31545.1 transcriptional regulator [Kurthia zopfii]